ncbi:NADH-quinone oxidoreductase subunit N [Runella slithyformis]|uniref:NADH-quinone oxidoreductase subunit N n=1 Tax=Runella slithyformis (strain ATCC 29530 / DSM 19594 / LMG 11500 / NCIMB 11436 / LSU 4) TaxID=761193 RepID=A0A7U3ZK41_RUNSL|nr:NADH-quinone oxidoreductase subunit N [Runella slithyformis]AEI48702.1 NAD(P)H-quinone oxidoreductase subunit 2 [Runella slithyformis DSM 19594]
MRLQDHLYHVIQSLPGFIPETWLAGAFLFIILSEILLKYSRWQSQTNGILRALTVILLTVAFGLVFLQWNDLGGYLFHHLIYLDHKAGFFKLLILTATLLVLLHVQLMRTDLPAEFYSLLLAVVLGLFLMTMAVNGLSMYLSIELVSIGSYLMATLGKGKTSGEGGIKYLLFGALSSAIMLYGLSLLYGMTGTLNFTSDVFAHQLTQNPPIILLVVGFLTLGGVLFKLSLVPFHVWPPDVYEAAPTPVVSFLSTTPKAAALLLLMRLLSVLPADFQKLTAIIALVSILAGNLAALWQNDLKRLMAYSGIAQAGFMIVGLAALNQTGFESTTFYVTIYVLTNLAVFLLIDLLGQITPTLASIAGKGVMYPFLSVCFTLLIVALVGLPPTAGFTAKLLVFSSLWEAYQTTGDQLLIILLALGLLNAVVSLFYYFKVPFYLFFRTAASSSPADRIPYTAAIAVSLLTLTVLLLFFKTDWLLDWIRLL